MKPTLKNAQTFEENTPEKKPKRFLTTFILCIIVSIGISCCITLLLIPTSPPTEYISDKDSEQDAFLTSLQELIAEQNTKIEVLESQNESLKTHLRHSSATALKNILINQEESIQSYLRVTQSAVNDLSNLIPESVDWNHKYRHQLDLAQKNSLKREDLLRLLKTGAPND